MKSEYTEEYGCKTNTKANLKDIVLYEENDTYFLDVSYIVEDMQSVYMLRIPKIILPILKEQVVLHYEMLGHSPWIYVSCNGVLGNTKLMAIEDENGKSLTKTVIENKVHEMTLAEVEERLGYRIKIVDSK